MKTKFFVMLAFATAFSSPAFAGDGAENSNINIENEAKTAVAVTGELNAGMFGAKTGGTRGEGATAGSVKVKGSVKNTNMNLKNKVDTAVAVGNATAGSVTVDLTNH